MAELLYLAALEAALQTHGWPSPPKSYWCADPRDCRSCRRKWAVLMGAL